MSIRDSEYVRKAPGVVAGAFVRGKTCGSKVPNFLLRIAFIALTQN